MTHTKLLHVQKVARKILAQGMTILQFSSLDDDTALDSTGGIAIAHYPTNQGGIARPLIVVSQKVYHKTVT
jgi:hypothetical protein